MSNVNKQEEIDSLQADGKKVSKEKRRETTSANVSKYLYVAAFAYFGVSARVLLTWLSRAVGNPLLERLGDNFFLPNIFGSFLLGLVNGPLSDRLAKFDSTKALQTGLASGFCGSCTTFATWQLIAAQRLLTGDWSTALVQSVITFCTSYMAAGAGRSIGQNAPPRNKLDREDNNTSTRREFFDRMKLLFSLVVFIVPTIIVWARIGIEANNERLYFWVAVAFSPLGALIRYALSLRNASHPNFPLYTLVVNLCGCFGNISILVLADYLRHTRSVDDQWLAVFNLWILNGISVGLMGSLSTVSTWVNEIWRLANNGRMYYSYRYAVASVICAQVICLSIGATYMVISGRTLAINDIN